MAAYGMLLHDQHNQQDQVRREKRRFRERLSPLDELSPRTFQKKYRFDHASIYYITELIGVHLEPPTQRNHALNAETQVLVALKYFASGSILDDIGDIFGLDKGTVSRIIHRVAQLSSDRRNEFIAWPNSQDERRRIREGFGEKAAFPNLIGCVDGSHIKIQAPTPPSDYPQERLAGYEAAFVCRKFYHSINVKAVCDHEAKLTNIVARWPGSTHDSHIFKESLIGQYLERRVPDGFLLGDSAYPCTPYLLTPFISPSTRKQKRYNAAHKTTRSTIERSFGIMKRRFRVLKGMRFQPGRVCSIIIACGVLHNIAIDRKQPLPESDSDSDDSDDDDDDGEVYRGNHDGL